MLTHPKRWFVGTHPHLSDESLLELHALLSTGEHAVAARYLRHVRGCDDCTDRLEALRVEMTTLQDDVLAAADARCSSARLDRQFDVIMRRLDGQSGRVLAFPRVAAARRPVGPAASRWVAMAAACGLVIGLGVGRLIGPFAGARGTWQPGTRAAGTLPATVQQESDEQMLVEIEAALTRSRTKEFRALDELTPRVMDARARAGR